MNSKHERVQSAVSVSVIVPIYNEEKLLLGTAEELATLLDGLVGAGRWQFVLVNNGSTDRSSDICDEIVGRWPASINVMLDRPDYGEALSHGLMAATGVWAFVINVDFWDASFMRWCYRTRGIYDVVVGSKRADMALNTQSKYRRILSWGLNTILQGLFGFVGSDTHGQKFLHLPTTRPILQRCVMRRGQFDTEFMLRASRALLWLAEVPVPISEMRRPRNLMLHKIFRNFVDITRLRRVIRQVPIRAAVRYHRWAREDVENLDSDQLRLMVEMGRMHRRSDVLDESVLATGNRSRATLTRSE